MTEPTDAEIIVVAREAGLLPDNSHPAPETRVARKHSNAVLAFARAVLAKWRTPAPMGVEPVAHIQRDTLAAMLSTPSVSKTPWPIHRLREWEDKVEYAPLYTAEQAQAGAVSLNHKNIDPVRRFLADRGIYLSDETIKALITVSHGIKGGQHADI